MAQHSQPSSVAGAGHLALAAGWWRGGLALVRRDAALWTGMAAICVVAALLLKRVPLFGVLVLVLLAPVPIAGALLAARRLAAEPHSPPSVPANLPGRLTHYLLRPAAMLLHGTRDTDQMLRLTLACIVTLGLFLAVVIPEALITGGSVITGFAGTRYVNAPLQPLALVGVAAVVGLYALLVMALHFFVPLVVLGAREPMAAVAESFMLWRRHAAALALYCAPFLVPVVLIAAAFATSATHWLGYLLVLTLGTTALALFVAGTFVAYQALAPVGAPR
jgi:hypothetical protein